MEAARDAQRPSFGGARQSFWKNLAAEQHQRGERNHRERERPVRVEDHAERDGEHRGVGEGVSERERGQQILRMFEQPGDGLARARIFFREERDLPFAERKQRRFRQREKKLAPAKTKIAVIAVSTRGVCRKNGAEKKEKAETRISRIKFVQIRGIRV